ncbi:MAG: VanW family protein [Firmicutes bacterium]|nr:VanW family protein [Bacillota bacterium]
MKRQRKAKTKEFSKSKAVRITVIVLAVLIALTGGVFAALNPGNRIAKGVSVNGINVGHMTQEEAKKAITDGKDFAGQAIILKDSVSGAEKSFAWEDAELKRDIDKTVEEAYKIGRGDGLIGNTVSLVKLLFSQMNIPYSYTYNEEKLSGILYDFGVFVNGEQNNYVLEYGDGIVKVKKGTKGQDRDVSDLVEAVISSLQREENSVLLKLETKNPPEPDAESLYKEIYIKPQDATYEIADGKMTITPEQVGREIDKAEAEANIDAIKAGNTVTLKLITLNPEVTESSINAQLFGTVLGKFATSYATSSKNRSDNVELAASRINGIILMPNDEFSYNKVVGQRTAANGFKEAPVFENGETVQGMGGGVCQVSSTLYSAVLYADLQVLERQSHSLTVSYVPKGQDATVAYGSIDFRFKNNTKNPIKITAKTGGKSLEISVWGAKPETQKKVEIINTVTETKSPTVEEVTEPSMKLGERKVISNGKTGYTVATVRKVYENGKEVKAEKMPVSKYKMVPTKVMVGSASVPVFDEVKTEDNEKTEEKTEEKKEEKTEEKTEQKPEKTIERPGANTAQEEE